MSGFHLRPLKLADAELVFGWRNEPYILNLGSLKKEVSWEEHLNWIKNTVTNPERQAYILEVLNMPAGQVRFDAEGKENCFISVYVIKEFAGKVLGIEFIKQGCAEIYKAWPQLKKIIALVRLENGIGQKAFLKAGFLTDETLADTAHAAFTLIRN